MLLISSNVKSANSAPQSYMNVNQRYLCGHILCEKYHVWQPRLEECNTYSLFAKGNSWLDVLSVHTINSQGIGEFLLVGSFNKLQILQECSKPMLHLLQALVQLLIPALISIQVWGGNQSGHRVMKHLNCTPYLIAHLRRWSNKHLLPKHLATFLLMEQKARPKVNWLF